MSDEELNDEVEANSSEEEAEEKEEPKGLSEEEVNKRIEAARKQEKDKLYDSINSLKDEVANLKGLREQERKSKEKVEKEAKEKAEKERLAALSSEEKLAEQLKKIEEQLAREAEAREALQVRLDSEKKLRELEEYKASLLREAGDEIIPELVTGESREEIERNTALAKSRYQQIFDIQAAKAKGNTPRMPGPTNPDPGPVEEAELAQTVGDFEFDRERYYGSKKVKRDDAYAAQVDKQRKEVFAKIEQAYKRQSGY